MKPDTREWVKKAALNAPHSKRFAKFGEARKSRERLEMTW